MEDQEYTVHILTNKL